MSVKKSLGESATRSLQVVAAAPDEEYILGDPVEQQRPASVSVKEKSTQDIKQMLSKWKKETPPVIDDKSVLKDLVTHVKNENHDVLEQIPFIKKEEPVWDDNAIEEELDRFTNYLQDTKNEKWNHNNSPDLQPVLKIEDESDVKSCKTSVIVKNLSKPMSSVSDERVLPDSGEGVLEDNGDSEGFVTLPACKSTEDPPIIEIDESSSDDDRGGDDDDSDEEWLPEPSTRQHKSNTPPPVESLPSEKSSNMNDDQQQLLGYCSKDIRTQKSNKQITNIQSENIVHRSQKSRVNQTESVQHTVVNSLIDDSAKLQKHPPKGSATKVNPITGRVKIKKFVYDKTKRLLPRNNLSSVVSSEVGCSKTVSENFESNPDCSVVSVEKSPSACNPSKKCYNKTTTNERQSIIQPQAVHTESIFCQCVDCKMKMKELPSVQDKRARDFVCKICSRAFLRRQSLSHHVDRHNGLKKYSCKQCCKGFTTKHGLKIHKNNVHSTEKQKCRKCAIVFKNELSLYSHTRKKHKESNLLKTPVSCQECGKSFNTRKTMLVHYQIFHGPKGEFICNDCSATFTRKDNLVYHVIAHHLPPTVKCTKCPDLFCTTGQLTNHMRSQHLVDKRKTFVCDVCGKSTRNKVAFKSHLLTHTNDRPFVCEECGKCFRTQTNLHQHSRTHSDIRPYTCDVCEKSFRIRNHLKQHMAVHGMASTPTYRKRKRRSSSSNDSSSEDT